MDRNVRQSGFALVLAGGLGVLFFWLSDPRFGLRQPHGPVSANLPPAARDAAYSVIDTANEALLATGVGLAGSGLVLCTGLWLVSRRTQ